MPIRNLPCPLTTYPKIEEIRLGLEISNFRENGWEIWVAPLLKNVHLADINKEVHEPSFRVFWVFLENG